MPYYTTDPRVSVSSSDALTDMAKSLNGTVVFIAGSTGPLDDSNTQSIAMYAATAVVPRKGDSIFLQDGRRLVVVRVNHTVEMVDGLPTLQQAIIAVVAADIGDD
jgi:hypothetical protein